jgi:hypothetical protein
MQHGLIRAKFSNLEQLLSRLFYGSTSELGFGSGLWNCLMVWYCDTR